MNSIIVLLNESQFLKTDIDFWGQAWKRDIATEWQIFVW